MPIGREKKSSKQERSAESIRKSNSLPHIQEDEIHITVDFDPVDSTREQVQLAHHVVLYL